MPSPQGSAAPSFTRPESSLFDSLFVFDETVPAHSILYTTPFHWGHKQMKHYFGVWLTVMICIFAFCADGAAEASQPGTGQYEELSVQKGRTISGVVRWKGRRPIMASYPINRDESVCDPQKKRFKPSPRLVIGPGGGIANTVVYLSNIRRGKKAAATGLSQARNLSIQGCEYRPHVLLAPIGSYLAMHNRDRVLHNIRMFGAATYNLPMPEPGTLFVKPLRQPGLITLRNDAGHGWMSAIIYVTPHPYYVISDQEGRFTLQDVPPGTYTIKAWHEGWRITRVILKNGEPAFYEHEKPIVLSQEVTVSAGGENGGSKVNVEFTLEARR